MDRITDEQIEDTARALLDEAVVAFQSRGIPARDAFVSMEDALDAAASLIEEAGGDPEDEEELDGIAQWIVDTSELMGEHGA
ncbi:MAG: hypothetical protein V2J02_19300 [Pseudomonadales bacterium]|jgi:hypothetical protein|nr:hypothetical protein [Pseudomonadales bacterium]